MNRSLFFPIVSMFVGVAFAVNARGEEVTFRVTGLFMAEREDDLRKVDEGNDLVEIVRVDFETAEVTFRYEATAEPFKDADAEKVRVVIDNLLKNGSNHTFGALLPSGIPKEKLEKVEIRVEGLDCKACSYAVYRSIFQMEGVVRATANFRDGLVMALIEPGKTNRAALEEALKKRGVALEEAHSE